MEIYTKEDFKQIFIDLGIQKGSKVLLEADLDRYSGLVGNAQMLIETLQELIGDTGLLCMPCFSYSCLDPACLENYYPYEKWKEVRENLPGFHVIFTPSEIYKDCTNLFLRYKDVYRSNHPVYSFAYWGNFDEEVLKVDVNVELMFVICIEVTDIINTIFQHRNALNLRTQGTATLRINNRRR